MFPPKIAEGGGIKAFSKKRFLKYFLKILQIIGHKGPLKVPTPCSSQPSIDFIKRKRFKAYLPKRRHLMDDTKRSQNRFWETLILNRTVQLSR